VKRIALLTAVALVAFAWVETSTGSSPGAGVAAASAAGGYQVRALFDNAAFAVPGEQVRIAGAPVGTISAITVTNQDLAAVTLSIDNSAFVPFHANATCTIRPQSLIAERFVDCDPGTSATRALALIRRGGGAGTYLLPVSQTSSSIDPDIVQDISQEPIRERLAIILNELGTGLAARGADLNAVILRANPALGATDDVAKILAKQDHVLADLARDSDTVLAPLAHARGQLADFVKQANTTAVASAQRASDISQGIELLPSFLSQLRPLLADLGRLANQGTPLMTSLTQSADAVNQQFSSIVPFATAARTALIDLGNAAQSSQGSLIETEPLAQRLLKLGTTAQPVNEELDELTSSLQSTGAIQDLMGVLFYGTGASNGFDADGHYLRTDALVGSCTAYARTPVPGCSSNFASAAASADLAAARDGAHASARVPASTATAAAVVREAVSRAPRQHLGTLAGLLRYLVGGGSSTAKAPAR
jgi:phospholipid/cholesterol/gamma-HCH transport system substrate-binding protein